MAVGSFAGGLARGLELGMAMDRYKRERERAPILEAQQDELYMLNKQLTEMRLEELKDARKRRDALRSLNAGIAAVEAGQVNHPDVIDALNTVYGSIINDGTDENIVKKRVSRIIPAPGQPGKFALELEVTRKDGTTYRAPFTVGRSTDPNDPVQVFDLGESMDFVMSTKDLLERLESAATRYGDDKLLEHRRNLRRDTLKHRQALELEGVKHRNRLAQIKEMNRGRAAGRGSAQLEYDQWKIDMLVEIGFPKDLARRMVILKHNIPHSEVLKAINRLKENRDKNLFPGQEGWMSDEEIERSVFDLVDRIRRDSGAPPRRPPASEAAPAPATAPSTPSAPRHPHGPPLREQPPAPPPVRPNALGLDPSAFGPPTSMPRPEPRVLTLKPTYRAPNGRVVTKEEIERTARNRGLNPQQVIEILQLQ